MTSPGANLCAACGLCCNGVLFQAVVLQPEDSPSRLAILGLKIKRRRTERIFSQPCRCHDGAACTIYADRPVRCRRFACRQLEGLEAGQISGDQALAAVAEAVQRVRRVKDLLCLAGDSREHKPLADRCAAALSPPFDPSDGAAALRGELQAESDALESLLARDFRMPPALP